MTRWRARAAERNPLPPGAAAVGIGLVVSGIGAYAYLVITSRVLGPERYSPLSALWALVFVAAPGLFLPLEQEVGRALAARRAMGVGGRPVLVRAATLGGGLAAVLVVAAALGGGVIIDRLFDGQGLLLIGFAVAIAGYPAFYLGRGALAGTGRFPAYGSVLVIEAVLRVGMTVVLAIAGVRSAGVMSLAIGIPALAAIAVVALRERDAVQPGPPAAWSELGTAVSLLLAGSLLAQLLLNIAPLAVKVVVTDDPGAAGRFLDGIIVARIPLFFFQAVQASLLPRLAAQAASRHFDEFRATIRVMLAMVAGIVVLSTVGMFLLGPFAVRVLFGSGFALGRTDLALLAFGSEMLMAGLTLGQGSIALGGYGRAALGWAAGVLTVAAGLVLLPGGVVRVEVAFCAGSVVAAAALGIGLNRRLAHID